MISGLDVETGISMIGGSEEHYTELLEVSAKSLSTSLEKLETFLLEDLRRFEIEVHGTKGALLNIGAKELGEKALELENAAKNDDAEACYALYAGFSKSLRSFVLELAAIVTKDAGPREQGDPEALASGLRRARECCEFFDSFTAIDILSPLARFRYDVPDGPRIEGALDRLIALLENLEYDEALKEIASMTDMLGLTDP
jgi:HPt (histidine-containing phosphotransfer) domain-containing protein